MVPVSILMVFVPYVGILELLTALRDFVLSIWASGNNLRGHTDRLAPVSMRTHLAERLSKSFGLTSDSRGCGTMV